MNGDCLLAIDQGTTSTRAMAFSAEGEILAQAQQPFEQIYPQPGWVEHDPEVLWATTLTTTRQVLAQLRRQGRRAAALGITNQRETAVVWDRATGAPVGNAIVWQDRRTAPQCRALAEAGHEETVAARTGLRLDPYFSATKFAWILENTPGAREAAEAGRLAFGTVDSFLIWRLTGGREHLTDATNASRTALYDIHAGRWDAELCALFGVPTAALPEVRGCTGPFGTADAALLGEPLPIAGVAGDQQAALVGQAGFAVGDLKSTYGTGAFLILNTGDTVVRSQNRLLSTVAYQLDDVVTYGLEGSILSAGSTIQWLRDGLGLIARASEIEALARSAPADSGVYLVPAFTGLGAPWWDPDARGALVGLTRGCGRAEIARAGLEAAAFQTRDLFDAMAADGVRPTALKVDGGMTENGLLLQMLADFLDLEVVRPVVTETTALGAAVLAGLGCGIYGSLEETVRLWRADVRCGPQMASEARERALAGWRRAVQRVRCP